MKTKKEIDQYILVWPVKRYFEAKNLSVNFVNEDLPMSDRTGIYRWWRSSATPLKAYKALIQKYGSEPTLFEDNFKLVRLNGNKLRPLSDEINYLAEQYDFRNTAGRFHASQLKKVPIISARFEDVLKKVRPTFDAPVVQTHAPQASVTKDTPQYSQNPQASAETHAGMAALIRLCSSLKAERDGYVNQHTDFINQISEKNRTINDLTNELEEAKRMLDEALSAVPAPTPPSPEVVRSEQLSEMSTLVDNIDPGLRDEINKIDPKLLGQG